MLKIIIKLRTNCIKKDSIPNNYYKNESDNIIIIIVIIKMIPLLVKNIIYQTMILNFINVIIHVQHVKIMDQMKQNIIV